MNSWWCGEMDENEGGLCADAMVASAVSDAVVDGGAAVKLARSVVVARTVAPPLLREWRKMVALSR
ncbi:hypothetical protein DEO72_LG3g1684 [Vigna unguiculata]|uniref:Uncharacterized protein n=1 Tax=Vigna unguiculata TaxID=3917 RepID=A0A4D6LF73_VIGUN|nr:hypothetical protein DEO72_LG3g1684 [Vigna unguiculata]